LGLILSSSRALKVIAEVLDLNHEQLSKLKADDLERRQPAKRKTGQKSASDSGLVAD